MSFEQRASEYKQRMLQARVELPVASQLALYALFKQATLGDAPVRPAMSLDARKAMMHREWATLRGTSRDEAAGAYLDLAERLCSDPSLRA